MGDRILVCKECGEEFVFTAAEQALFQQRGLVNDPKRCLDCRSKFRAQRKALTGKKEDGSSPEVVCAICSSQVNVRFRPLEGRPVYCPRCYAMISYNPGRKEGKCGT